MCIRDRRRAVRSPKPLRGEGCPPREALGKGSAIRAKSAVSPTCSLDSVAIILSDRLCSE
eukprot:3377522-Pyramimonas_sp.AAC.1